MTTALALTPAVAPAPVYRQPAPTAKRQRTKPTILLADELPARKAKTSRVAKPVAPTTLEQEAARLGFPSTLFGFTPNQREYWAEPSMPWLTREIWENAPLGYNGFKLIWHYGEVGSNTMAPRFPKGCMVNMTPVYEKKNLVVGKVYIYVYTDTKTGELAYQMGRLEKVGGNCLWARADNDPALGLCWLLRDDERQAVWDVYEVTHYTSYPDLDTLPSAS